MGDIAQLASRLVDNLLADVVLDVALEAHRAVKLARSKRPIPPTVPPTNGAATPDPFRGTGDAQNPLFACTVCQRPIASSRYAPHLTSCLGLGAGSRRSASTRAAKAGSRMGSATPSVNGEATDEEGSANGAGGVNGNAGGPKRAASPSKPPSGSQTKKPKITTSLRATRPRQSSPLSQQPSLLPHVTAPASAFSPTATTTSAAPTSPASSTSSVPSEDETPRRKRAGAKTLPGKVMREDEEYVDVGGESDVVDTDTDVSDSD